MQLALPSGRAFVTLPTTEAELVWSNAQTNLAISDHYQPWSYIGPF